MRFKLALKWLAIGLILGLSVDTLAQTNVANSAADLAGKILMVADSALGRTVTNLFLFDRGAAVPFAVGASSLKVTNLDADKLDGIDSTGFVTPTGSVTLTNKTLTAPILGGSVTGTYTLTSPTIAGPSVTGVMLSALGAVGAPSYSFTGDANTGLWSAGADTLSLSTNGVKALEVDSTQFIDSATQPRAGAYNNTTQSLTTGTETVITFNTEDFDVGAMHDTGSNTSRFTVPTGGDGVYLFMGTVVFAASADGNGRYAYWRKNGTTAITGLSGFVGTSAQFSGASITGLAVLAAADYIELLGYQNSGGSLNTGSATRSQANGAQVIKLW